MGFDASVFSFLVLKQFFTSSIADDPESAAIVSAIVAMAHNMNLKVIAEGIEDDRQLESLRSLDQHFFGSPVCDGVQGYLFSKPVSVDMIEKPVQFYCVYRKFSEI